MNVTAATSRPTIDPTASPSPDASADGPTPLAETLERAGAATGTGDEWAMLLAQHLMRSALDDRASARERGAAEAAAIEKAGHARVASMREAAGFRLGSALVGAAAGGVASGLQLGSAIQSAQAAGAEAAGRTVAPAQLGLVRFGAPCAELAQAAGRAASGVLDHAAGNADADAAERGVEEQAANRRHESAQSAASAASDRLDRLLAWIGQLLATARATERTAAGSP